MKELCCWGCGQVALLPKTKYGKGPRCTERHYDCPEYKKNQSDRNIFKGTHNKPNNLKYSWVGRLLSEEHKKAISRGMMGNTNANHRGDRQSFYNGIRMDSRWEIWTAEWFDLNSIEWIYNERGFKLSNERYYYPDFFIYDNSNFIKLIEVKGYFRKRNKQKFEQFLKEYPHIVVELWTKKELYDRQIINKSGQKGSVFC